MKNEKIGFFGGCFNPPTNVHIGIAKKLITKGLVDKVVFIPVGDYYPKNELIKAQHRYNMLKLACQNEPNIDVDDIALKEQRNLYATDTFELIQNKYTKEDIYFIMGSDNFEKMPNWKNYDALISKYKFIVIERLKHEINQKHDNVIYYKTNLKEDVSSSNIRKMLKSNKSTEHWLNPEVMRYIQKNKLYSEQNT